MSAVLLVPGSWHGAWCWTEVIDRLARHRASACARSSCPSNDGPSGLADDAAAVRDAIAGIGEPTVVVGHSYGGVAISEGAADAAGLVYLCAFMLDAGESLLDAMQHQLPDWIEVDEAAGSHLATRTGRCSTATARPERGRAPRVRDSPASPWPRSRRRSPRAAWQTCRART